MPTKRTKSIDGKKYEFFDVFDNDGEAYHAASNLRFEGALARVIEVYPKGREGQRFYTVWYREK